MEAITSAVTGAMSAFTTGGATFLGFVESEELILFGVGMAIVGWIVGKCLNAVRGL
jgi:hypothetical protein